MTPGSAPNFFLQVDSLSTEHGRTVLAGRIGGNQRAPEDRRDAERGEIVAGQVADVQRLRLLPTGEVDLLRVTD